MMRAAWIALAMILAGTAVASNPPSPSGAKAREPKQLDATQPDTRTNANNEPSQQLPVVIKNIFEPQVAEGNGTTERNRGDEGIWIAISSLASVALVIITGLLVRFTKRLWESTHGMLTAAATQSNAMQESNRQAAISAVAIGKVADAMATNVEFLRTSVETGRSIAARQRLTTEMQLRARVFPTGVSSLYSKNDRDLFEWQLKVGWTNIGATPTRKLILCTTADIRTALPDTFDFPFDEGHITKGGILLPNTPLNTGAVPWGRKMWRGFGSSMTAPPACRRR
jgi:hypothetical protein